MKKRSLEILLISFIGLFFCFINTQAVAENWKRFFNDEKGIWYYDKDSLHYPYNTKGFLGAMKTDKNVVRVWIKVEDWWMILEELHCPQREIKEIDLHSLGYHPAPGYDPLKLGINPDSDIRIVPGSWKEKLYNEVCR